MLTSLQCHTQPCRWINPDWGRRLLGGYINGAHNTEKGLFVSKLVVDAMNIHQGGGAVVLNAFLQQQKPDILLHDARMVLPKAAAHKMVAVPPTLFHRLKSQKMLANIAKCGDQLICFGNLPPLWRQAADVKVFVQNKLLLIDANLHEFPLRSRFRLLAERWWLRRLKTHADLFIVQTPSMASLIKSALNLENVEINNYLPTFDAVGPNCDKEYDYLYVADASPHKNHRRLLEAWVQLAKAGQFPTLALTVKLEDLTNRDLITQFDLKVSCLGQVPHETMSQLYAESKVLIYPSLSESLGLPLIEATHYGLPIVASDRDFVRDACIPKAVFDPESVESIVAAVTHQLKRRTQ